MRNINKVIISGNLTRDIEIRETKTGMVVATFGLAVNDSRKNPQTGEWEDYPNFINCNAFGDRWLKISNFVGKGNKVCVEGKLRWSQWEQDGQKRSKVEVIVDQIEFMSKSGEKSDDSANYGGDDCGVDASYYDEDIPF